MTSVFDDPAHVGPWGLPSIWKLEQQAAAQAVEETQRFWLPILETQLQELSSRLGQPYDDLEQSYNDLLLSVGLSSELKRLRRALRLGPDPNLVREQNTRARAPVS